MLRKFFRIWHRTGHYVVQRDVWVVCYEPFYSFFSLYAAIGIGERYEKDLLGTVIFQTGQSTFLSV